MMTFCSPPTLVSDPPEDRDTPTERLNCPAAGMFLSYSHTEYAEKNFFRKRLGTLTQIRFDEFHYCFSCAGAAHFLLALLFESRRGF
jgi:hypothetical protein